MACFKKIRISKFEVTKQKDGRLKKEKAWNKHLKAQSCERIRMNRGKDASVNKKLMKIKRSFIGDKFIEEQSSSSVAEANPAYCD